MRAIIADYRMHGALLWSRFNAGKEEQQWFYRGCVTALAGGSQSLIRELNTVVQELERL